MVEAAAGIAYLIWAKRQHTRAPCRLHSWPQRSGMVITRLMGRSLWCSCSDGLGVGLRVWSSWHSTSRSVRSCGVWRCVIGCWL